MAKKIDVYGELNSRTGDGVLADASQIWDSAQGKFQDEINQETANDGLVSVKVEQEFTDEEKAQGRENIGAVGFVDNGAYDVTANNNNIKFENLADLLGRQNLNTLIPTTVRKGGMSVKFVQSSDNKYVQYRLMSDTFNTTLANWQGVDDEPTAGSNNLVKSGGIFESTVLYENSTNKLIQKDFSSLIKVGNIYNGNYYSGSKENLMINKYFEADDLKYLRIHLAEDIKIRVSFYDNNKSHISNTGNYANLKFVEIPAGTKYYRLSADYSAKGYSNSNPITVTDYTIGDFYVENWEFKVDETPTRNSNNLVTSDGISKVINGEIDCTKLIETGYDDTSSWIFLNGYVGVCIKCSANDVFIITAGANAPWYSFLTEVPLVQTSPVPRVAGTTRQRLTANSTTTIVIPEGTSYLYLSKVYDLTNTLPEKLIFVGKYYGIVDNLTTNNPLLPIAVKQNILVNKISDVAESLLYGWNAVSRTYFMSGGNYRGIVDVANKDAITVRHEVYFRTNKLTHIKVFNNSNRNDGSYWRTRVVFFGENKAYLSQTSYIKDINVEVPSNAFYYKLTFELYTIDNENYYSATDKTVSPYMLGINDLVINDNCMDDENKVIERNNDVSVACVCRINNDTELRLGHISDIHGDMSDKQFADFVRVCNTYCDLGIITGDIVYNNFTHTFNYYNNYIGKSKNKVLLTIGNHDVGSSNIIAECGTHQEVYDKFFDPYIADWGVTYESGKNYYYKDYSDKKIRVIVMYDYDSPLDIDPEDNTKYKYFRGNLAYSTEQLTWLISVLQDAATKNYSVVIAKHMMEGLVSGQSAFMTANNPSAIYMNHILNNRTPVGDIVNAFQNSGIINVTYNTTYGTISAIGDFSGLPNGKFAAYICGHYHCDIVGTLVKYPSQNVIAVDCDNSHNQSGTDIFKTPGERSMDSINIYKISDANRRITISRIGGNYSNTAQHRDMIMLTY